MSAITGAFGIGIGIGIAQAAALIHVKHHAGRLGLHLLDVCRKVDGVELLLAAERAAAERIEQRGAVGPDCSGLLAGELLVVGSLADNANDHKEGVVLAEPVLLAQSIRRQGVELRDPPVRRAGEPQVV
jgi:hypothetical protein